MGKQAAIPSLTAVGYITNKNLQMSKLFSYFLASDYLQSNIFKDRIKSLKYLLTRSSKPDILRQDLETTLKELYEPYYDRVQVQVDQEDLPNNIVNLSIGIRATYDNVDYFLYKEIKTKEGDMVEFEKQLDELYEIYGGN